MRPIDQFGRHRVVTRADLSRSHLQGRLHQVVLVLPALLIGGAELCLKKSWKISLKQRMSRFSGNADVAVSGPIA